MTDAPATRPDLDVLAARRAELRERHVLPPDRRPASTARGLHHTALISSDVERTIGFYQGLLGFPLTELIENRDYPGSSHFFFDIGHDNLLAFFDFPGLGVGPYAEVLGGLHHLVQRQLAHVDEQLRSRDTQLHQVDEVGATAEEPGGPAVARPGPYRVLGAVGAYVGEGLHGDTSSTASTIRR